LKSWNAFPNFRNYLYVSTLRPPIIDSRKSLNIYGHRSPTFCLWVPHHYCCWDAQAYRSYGPFPLANSVLHTSTLTVTAKPTFRLQFFFHLIQQENDVYIMSGNFWKTSTHDTVEHRNSKRHVLKKKSKNFFTQNF
jgi:hypothetical protein